jgi:hypothetical protein
MNVSKSCSYCGKDFATGDVVKNDFDDHGNRIQVHQSCRKSKPAAPAKKRKLAKPVPDVEIASPFAPRATIKKPEFDSKLEEAYWHRLKDLQAQGVIHSFALKPEKLRLADGSYYTPDFRVITPTGEVQFHETKGFMREAARVRLLVAAELHPYPFFLVKKSGASFTVERYGK